MMFHRLCLAKFIDPELKVYENPGHVELQAALSKSKFKQIRFMNIQNHLYIWPAETGIHDRVKNSLGFNNLFDEPKCEYYGYLELKEEGRPWVQELPEGKPYYYVSGWGMANKTLKDLLSLDSSWERMVGKAPTVYDTSAGGDPYAADAWRRNQEMRKYRPEN